MGEPNPNNVEAFESICEEFERAWLQGATPRLEERWSASDSDERFEELLAIECDCRERLGQRPSAVEYLSRFPQNRTIVERVLGDRSGEPLPYVPEAVLDQTIDLGNTTLPMPTGQIPGEDGQWIGGYEILETIGLGGMGVVYRARQRELNRIVALKMIRSEVPQSPEQLTRFRIEAQAAARLDHPGIVPVFDVGQIDGAPYYAMAYVDDKSLSELVHDQPLEPKRAAEICCRLAEAIQFAHKNDVIHRDLKPQNVLMDGDQPRITDFGLARIQASDSELTSHGQILGTPSYMPPEQAAGQQADIGAAADIFSLGAILYRVLVGRPPFQAPSAIETLRQVIEQDPVPLRQLNSSIDRDLETICMRCLAKDPKKRFPTAGALGEDLQRYLDGRPIQSRRTSVRERLWLWCRRRPAVAALISALILVTITGFSLVTWKWREAEVANALAHEKNVLAHENLGQASAAVTRFYEIVAEAQLLNEPGLQPLRRELLEEALNFQTSFIASNGNNPTLSLDLADAWTTVARIHEFLGEISQATEEFQTADRAYQTARRLNPNAKLVRMNHCACLHELAAILNDSGKLNEAMAILKRSKALASELVAESNNGNDERDLLSTSHSLTGTVQESLGKHHEADKSYKSAVTIARDLVKENPNETIYRFNLAATLQNYAQVQRILANYSAAEASLNESVQLYDSIAKTHDDKYAVRGQRQMAQQLLKIVNEELTGVVVTNDDQGVDLIEKWKSMVRDNPQVREYRLNLLTAYRDRCFSMLRTGRAQDAIEFGRLATATGDKLLAEVTGDQEVMMELAAAQEYLGLAYQDAKQLTKSIDAFSKSIRLLQSLSTKNTDRIRNQLSGTLLNQGTAEMDSNDLQAAGASFRAAHKLAVELVKESPDVPTHRLLLAKTIRNLGVVQFDLGDDAGIQRIEEAVGMVRKLLAAKNANVETELEFIEVVKLSIGIKLDVMDESGLADRIGELIPVLKRQADRSPDDMQTQYDLAFNRGFYAELIGATDPAKAREMLTIGIADLKPVAKRFRKDRQIAEQLATMTKQLRDLD